MTKIEAMQLECDEAIIKLQIGHVTRKPTIVYCDNPLKALQATKTQIQDAI